MGSKCAKCKHLKTMTTKGTELVNEFFWRFGVEDGLAEDIKVDRYTTDCVCKKTKCSLGTFDSFDHSVIQPFNSRHPLLNPNKTLPNEPENCSEFEVRQ